MYVYIKVFLKTDQIPQSIKLILFKIKLLVNMIDTPMRFIFTDKCINIFACAVFPVGYLIVPTVLETFKNH